MLSLSKFHIKQGWLTQGTYGRGQQEAPATIDLPEYDSKACRELCRVNCIVTLTPHTSSFSATFVLAMQGLKEK